MPLHFPGSADAFHPKVRLHARHSKNITLASDCSTVWGVIWLLIAFIFFAAGVLVGIAAFKVLELTPRSKVTFLINNTGISHRTATTIFGISPCSRIQWGDTRHYSAKFPSCRCHEPTLEASRLTMRTGIDLSIILDSVYTLFNVSFA